MSIYIYSRNILDVLAGKQTTSKYVALLSWQLVVKKVIGARDLESFVFHLLNIVQTS